MPPNIKKPSSPLSAKKNMAVKKEIGKLTLRQANIVEELRDKIIRQFFENGVAALTKQYIMIMAKHMGTNDLFFHGGIAAKTFCAFMKTYVYSDGYPCKKFETLMQISFSFFLDRASAEDKKFWPHSSAVPVGLLTAIANDNGVKLKDPTPSQIKTIKDKCSSLNPVQIEKFIAENLNLSKRRSSKLTSSTSPKNGDVRHGPSAPSSPSQTRFKPNRDSPKNLVIFKRDVANSSMEMTRSDTEKDMFPHRHSIPKMTREVTDETEDLFPSKTAHSPRDNNNGDDLFPGKSGTVRRFSTAPRPYSNGSALDSNRTPQWETPRDRETHHPDRLNPRPPQSPTSGNSLYMNRNSSYRPRLSIKTEEGDTGLKHYNNNNNSNTTNLSRGRITPTAIKRPKTELGDYWRPSENDRNKRPKSSPSSSNLPSRPAAPHIHAARMKMMETEEEEEKKKQGLEEQLKVVKYSATGTNACEIVDRKQLTKQPVTESTSGLEIKEINNDNVSDDSADIEALEDYSDIDSPIEFDEDFKSNDFEKDQKAADDDTPGHDRPEQNNGNHHDSNGNTVIVPHKLFEDADPVIYKRDESLPTNGEKDNKKKDNNKEKSTSDEVDTSLVDFFVDHVLQINGEKTGSNEKDVPVVEDVIGNHGVVDSDILSNYDEMEAEVRAGTETIVIPSNDDITEVRPEPVNSSSKSQSIDFDDELVDYDDLIDYDELVDYDESKGAIHPTTATSADIPTPLSTEASSADEFVSLIEASHYKMISTTLDLEKLEQALNSRAPRVDEPDAGIDGVDEEFDISMDDGMDKDPMQLRVDQELEDLMESFQFIEKPTAMENQDLQQINDVAQIIDVMDDEKKKSGIEAFIKSKVLPPQIHIRGNNLQAVKMALLSGASLTYFIKAMSNLEPAFKLDPVMQRLLQDSMKLKFENKYIYYSPVFHMVNSLIQNLYIVEYLRNKKYKKEIYCQSKIFQEAFNKEQEGILYLYIDMYTDEVLNEISNDGTSTGSIIFYQALNIPRDAKVSNTFKVSSCVTDNLLEMVQFSLLEIEIINKVIMDEVMNIDGHKVQIVPLTNSSDIPATSQLFSFNRYDGVSPCHICDSKRHNDGRLCYMPYNGKERSNVDAFANSLPSLRNFFNDKFQVVYDPYMMKISLCRTLFSLFDVAMDDYASYLGRPSTDSFKKAINDISKTIESPYAADSGIVHDIFPLHDLSGPEYKTAINLLPVVVYDSDRVVNDHMKLLFILFFEFMLILGKQTYDEKEVLFVKLFPDLYYEMLKKQFPYTDDRYKKFYTLPMHQLYHISKMAEISGPLACYYSEGLRDEVDFVKKLARSSRYLPEPLNYKLASYNNMKYYEMINWAPKDDIDIGRRQNHSQIYIKNHDGSIKNCFAYLEGELVKIDRFYTRKKYGQTVHYITTKVIAKGKYELSLGTTGQILYATIDMLDQYIAEKKDFAVNDIKNIFYSCNYFEIGDKKMVLIRSV
ncbi:hypothetical protein DASC09_056340 [Saccharomycopsis crataegensis]|uniref:Uncharacterized protein n=1 Tax=Saccharomycopsis crataegensis TaxID=43959 RepID=A0AAV5QUM6_9ASCO|nr:hypothetical protein DASC09_056340 [Saccharomycopsis crataegensis]